MILLSLVLLGFAVVDLARWSPEPVGTRRAYGSTVIATAVAAGLACLSGWEAIDVVIVAGIMLVVLGVWMGFGQTEGRPGWALAWILVALLAAFAAGGLADAVSGPLKSWYSNLPFPFVRAVSLNEFLLGGSGGLFLLATANRIVRLVLEAAGTPAAVGETALRGGRILGPMERLFVAGMILSGDATGAAVVIAAKGLLRLPEIRSRSDRRDGAEDQVTEYFLIGTFCSLLLAGGLSAIILGSG